MARSRPVLLLLFKAVVVMVGGVEEAAAPPVVRRQHNATSGYSNSTTDTSITVNRSSAARGKGSFPMTRSRGTDIYVRIYFTVINCKRSM